MARRATPAGPRSHGPHRDVACLSAWSAAGSHTDGACFSRGSNGLLYGLGPDPEVRCSMKEEADAIEDILTVTPLGAAVAIPVAGWAGLALIGCLIAFGGVTLLRRV